MLEPCCRRFTAPEGGARLAASAARRNTVLTECGPFVSTRLLHEEAYHIRGPLSSGRQRSVRICQPVHVKPDAYELRILTDLQVCEAETFDGVHDWSQELETKEVLVCTSEVLRKILEEDILSMVQINILIIDSCHVIYRDENLQYIMKIYKQTAEDKQPRILALTYPLFNSTKKDIDKSDSESEDESTDNMQICEKPETIDKDVNVDNMEKTTEKKTVEVDEIGVYENLDDFEMYEKLEWRIDDMEKELCCKMDLAEDIDGCKRISGPVMKPKELIIEHSERPPTEQLPTDFADLEEFMRANAHNTLDFLHDHRHDPTEIYGDDLYEEFKNIPDPTIEPKEIFKEFLYVLDELGPYAADKAAFHLLIKLEKSKIKVPYERHFLLLRLCTTVFVKIRCYAELVFNKYPTDWDKIRTFSTPKLLRFVEILQKFTPPDIKEGSPNSKNSEKNDATEVNIGDSANGGSKIVKDNSNDSKVDSKCSKEESNNVKHDLQKFTPPNIKESKQNIDLKNSENNDATEVNIGDSSSCGSKVVKDISNDSKVDTKCSKEESNSVKEGSKDSSKLNASVMLKDIENCDFATLGDRIEDKLNSLKANLKDLEEDTKEVRVEKESGNVVEARAGRAGAGPRRWARGRGRGRPAVRAQAPAAHALCAVCYLHHALMAKILFMLCVELSRCVAALSYLRCQYCAPERGDARDAAKQGKRHEEVLKKFRMHECNLLLTTSVLEEGIDLPRCNLVLRWDLPVSYRSYGLCRGRARAPRAAAAVLCARAEHTMLHYMATYCELDQLITRKCGCGIQDEPTAEEEAYADMFTPYIQPYTPIQHTQTKTCTCSVKTEKNVENDMRKTKFDAAQSTRVTVECVSGKTDGESGKTNADSGKTDIDSGNTSRESGKSDVESGKSYVESRNRYAESGKSDVDSGNTNDGSGNTSRESGKSDVDYGNTSRESRKSDVESGKSYVESGKRYAESGKTDITSGTIDSVQGKMESVPETIDSHKLIPNLNKIETSVDYKTIERASLSFASNHVANVSEIIENFSKSIDDVSKSIDGITEAFNSIDSDVAKSIESVENHVDNVLSENMKNINICSDTNGDGKCDCLCDVKKDAEVASVDLSNAIALINRYCAKLPSDTFTRLAASWWCERVRLPHATRDSYICTLRLPLNCPLKYNIVGHPMPTRVLARRVAALQACRILHRSGELDNQLMPIGKENFKAAELETAGACNVARDECARPGTTKRRQYYYKRTAGAFIDCQPVIDASDSEIDPHGERESSRNNEETSTTNQTVPVRKRNMLYAIVSSLWCALPERYNTRGRRLHSPQHAAQALGILMARTEPTNLQIPAFPVYTRSGEVRVSVEHVPDADTRVSPRRGRLVRRFMRFVFTEVLRVRRRGMKLQSEGSTKNNYYIVPTVKIVKDGETKIEIDWPFLELIYQHTEEKKLSDVEKPLLWYQDEEETSTGDVTEKTRGTESDKDGELENPLLKKDETFVFDVEKYSDAVVTPWYRNRDQPQFFLVAEICWNLSPESAFPSAAHDSFRAYYRAKYNVRLTQPRQPLLDVDHTSARLNLLTPRYVNRKGVALPVSSERTRRAKRDRLDQKQILVPELCRVHPFAAPLWFSTVALPCVLYRINALLIADEIRRAVAVDVGLGIPKIDDTTAPGFHWPPLDFGWSLSEVLSADAEKTEKKKEDEKEKEKELQDIEEDVEKEKDQKEKELKDEQMEVTEQGDGETGNTGEKTINDILAEKMVAGRDESGFEIGTWSNDMASSIPDTLEYDEMMEPLPPNLTFCTSASGGVNWCDPVQKPKSEFNPNRVYSVADSDCSYISSDFDTDDSDLQPEESDEDTDTSGFCSSRASNNAVGVRIEYKTAHEAEAVDVGRKRSAHPAPQRPPRAARRDARELAQLVRSGVPDNQYVEKFRRSVDRHKNDIISKGSLIKKDTAIAELLPELPETRNKTDNLTPIDKKLQEIFPQNNKIEIVNGRITLESIERNKRVLLSNLKDSLTDEEVKKLNCFSMRDVDIDSPSYVNEKIVNVGFDDKEKYEGKVLNFTKSEFTPYYNESKGQNGKEFDFDYQPDLEGHPGPSPSVILQALTMSNANDGINLERLETIGDSFLKFAITAYLYCAHPTVHEGKLSHMRSKQVSNLNLYRLGRSKRLGARMIASKFEPHDNWLPPCHRAPPSPPLHRTNTQDGKAPEAQEMVTGCYIPYNLITQHSIPDKSIADCVEALIGAYLLECGPRGALLFMSWLGISVLPQHRVVLPPHTAARRRDQQKPPPTPSPKRQRTVSDSSSSSSSDVEGSEESQSEEEWEGGCEFVGPVGARRPYRDADGNWVQVIYGELKAPPSPLLRYIADPEGELEQMLSGYDALERTLQYRFKDRSLLLQAMTHASHQKNRLTDCYQRLEFLGDAILDYLITRHLYEDARRHCPGALTDLRSALVNNTIFATLAVRHGFHKYFRHMSPGLNEVLTKYVRIQEENGHSISEEHYLIQEDELEQAEDVEVPKALGDLFESVAGAIFLDSGMSLAAVWRSYVRLMGAELEAFSAAAPKSPVRELLEAEPDTAKFGKPERLADGRRVRVCVEVFGRGTFKGIGRNYRIAKGTAARCALRHLRQHRR